MHITNKYQSALFFVACVAVLLFGMTFVEHDVFRPHITRAQTPAYSCPAGQFTYSQLVNTGPSCAAIPGGGFQSLYFDLQPGLFSTATATASVYYMPNAVTVKAVVARITGSPICTAAPTVAILDLGTSGATVYASATVLVSQTTGTANGVFATTSASAAVAAGHYIGLGLSGGACVTPPTLDVTVEVQ